MATFRNEDVDGFLSTLCQNEVQTTFLSAPSDPVTQSLELQNSGVYKVPLREQQGNKEEMNEKTK
jgi:hypothetical protein